MEKRKAVHIYLPEELYDELKREAGELRFTLTKYLELIVAARAEERDKLSRLILGRGWKSSEPPQD